MGFSIDDWRFRIKVNDKRRKSKIETLWNEDGITGWPSAGAANADDLREHILTGYKAGKPFTPYRPTVALPSPIGTVLDFGCGVGRSFSFLRTIAEHVTGFDLPPMIERCRALAAEPVDVLADDWNDVRTRQFDLIFTALVLQHIEPAICRPTSRDFAAMSPAMYLLTRATSDFDTSVFRLVAGTGLFEPGPCVEVDPIQ